MFTDHDVRRVGSQILVGMAIENAVLDVVTDDELLRECIRLLQEPHQGLVVARMGTFGTYSVTLNVDHDEIVSIFVDGPCFETSRDQGMGIYVDKQDLRQLLLNVMRVNKGDGSTL